MALSLKQRIGLRVKLGREQASLTQEQRAALVDRTPETISNIERGQTLPSIEALESLGHHLKRPLRDFFDDAEEKHSTARHRLELEVRIKNLVQNLNDEGLEIAVKQIEALASRGQV